MVGFDMCLMAQYEVALELQGLAEVLVASQATEPGDGWPYDRVLPAFTESRTSTTALAGHMVEVFDVYYRERDEAITTLSAYDLSRLPAFTERFDALLSRLEPALPDLWPVLSRAIFFAEGYAPRTELQRSASSLASIDLLDALRRLELNMRNFPARNELRALERAHEQMLISNRTSPMRRLSNGLAIYAPVSAKVLNDSYDVLKINRETRWRRFLDGMHALQQAGDSKPVIRDIQLVDWQAERRIEEALPLNTHGISYVVEGSNLLWLRGLQGQWDEDGEGLLVSHRGEIMDANWSVRARDTAAERMDLMIPQFVDGANRLVTQLDGYRYMVTSGEKAYYSTIDESGDHILTPVVYHHPEAGDLGGTIYFHPHWWYALALEVELPQQDGSIVYRQVKPEPEHEITLLFEHLKRDGTMSYAAGRRIAWGSGPELILGLHEPGQHVIGLAAETIGGNSAHALFEYRVGEDEGLKSFMEQGADFTLEDLLGTWEMIEPEPLSSSGAIVPNGVLINYERHPDPERQALLISTMTAPQRNPDFAARELVFLDLRLLRHLRSMKLETVGLPDDPLGVEFSVSLLGLYSHDGRPILLTRNKVSGLNYAFAKTGATVGTGSPAAPQQPVAAQPHPAGPAAQPQPAQPTPPSAQPALSLDGTWQRHDGVILVIQGSQFHVSQFGATVDAGIFVVQGNVIASQSAYTGTVEQYQFTFDGRVLQLQDAWGGLYIYQRTQ
jgi:hypothetical protein